jgi:penicillin amidase
LAAQGGRRLRRVKGVAFLLLAVLLTLALNAPLGPLPALLPVLNPGQGVWTAAGTSRVPTSGQLRLPGLLAPVTVTYSAGGIPHIFAANDHDLFMAQGYLVARDRLFQMDLMRRQGAGTLAQVLGPSQLASDEAQLQLGLVVGAERTIAAMQGSAQGRATLQAAQDYADGVNALIRQEEASHTLPLYFKLLGYQPAPWTPLDSIMVQEDMEEVLSFSTAPLQMAVLAQHLGAARAASLVPAVPPDPQWPYDPGPYAAAAPAPLPPQAVTAAQGSAASQALADLAAVQPIIPGIAQGFEMSNNWAVSGALTASGKPILAGDPHLSLTLPSIWYEMQLKDPSYDVAGVNFPGARGIVIGHNPAAAWSATDTENQETFFYYEKTDAAHPGMYEFNGAWQAFTTRRYAIQVKGQAPVAYVVEWTNNGPLITRDGLRVAMDWTGDLASPLLTAILLMDRATTLSAFESALSWWSCPVQNWVFADSAGDIALMAPGLYPLVSHGNPALPLDGSGPEQWTGAIPASQTPRIVNPPWGFVWSANQRPVGASYPYFVGDSSQFANGYRADTIHDYLAAPANRPFTVQSMEKLQADNQDRLAVLLAPVIAAAGTRLGLTGGVGSAVAGIGSWDGVMDTGSVQATIYFYFFEHYLHDTFGPWWQQSHMPATVPISANTAPLVEDLESWTVADQASPWFHGRTPEQVQDQALSEALAELAKMLGPDPSGWQWGKVHMRSFPSLLGIAVLGRGPYPSGGDYNTPDAAEPSLDATSGPSWRMVVDLGNVAGAQAVYPGGQSENPVSAHYADGLPLWLDYQYRPLVFLAAPGAQGVTYRP